LRSLSARAERAVLIVLLDVFLAGLLWLAGAAAERPFYRWLRVRARKWIGTYRARLTLALFAFFVVPAVAFALWSYERLRSDDRQTRELLVNETLQTVGEDSGVEKLSEAGRRFDTPLFRYSAGFLDAASDSLYAALAPGGVALPSAVQLQITGRGELAASALEQIAGSDALLGYRAVLGPNEERYTLGAPARGDDLILDRRRRDLGILVLFSTALGALAALLLSGFAAKRLARDLELSRIEVARAERIIAWGEMARQVAHEIKNPLTPIRLGVQHLRRARKDEKADFDRILDENVGRILSEIDRLDSIARSFSRYGSAPADLPLAERIDVAAVVRDVIELERMGKGELKWRLRGADHQLVAMARSEELREVMLNVLENARLAGASRVDVTLREEEKRVTIETADDGSGISAAALPRIFEPHFSTRTTGSGLGLAASRRIIEQWGGEIAVTSEPGKGARVLIALVRPSA
jgi:signal transduction histidine kinase